MTKPQKIQGVKGMNDMLPSDAASWDYFEDIVRSLARGYGYQQIRTPIVEPTALFQRAVGEHTDIVEKEMYAFEDRLNGDQLCLRPENTAGVCRAAIEHGLLHDGGKRVWYMGPMFRHERPQRGRYRQFHQFGAEALGCAGPEVDAELIMMGARLWEDLELGDVRLQLNSLGNAGERAQHRAALIAYLEQHRDALDADAQRRLQTNPLRVLDSKNPDVQAVVQAAPKLIDYLGVDSQAHFDQLQYLLRLRGIAFDINPRLVRGLDYYNLTVFEWVTDKLGAQTTVCGGGRYDGLIELMGGKPTPACGFGLGVERVLDLLRQDGFEGVDRIDVYVVHAGEGALAQAMQVGELLRDQSFDVIVHAGEGGFKSQMKKADAAGATFAVIIGEDEVKANQVTLKPLRGDQHQPVHDGVQQRVSITELSAHLMRAFGAEDEHHHQH